MAKEQLITALVDLERDEVLKNVEASLEAGDAPLDILKTCQKGMSVIGERYETGDCFLSELIIAAGIFKQVDRVLTPHLQSTRPPTPVGRVVLATLRGDIHELGKNIFGTLLRASGFEVHDMGVDVQPAAVVEAVKELKPEFVGFSCLLSTAFQAMKETVDALREVGLRDGLKVLIGGGVTTPMLADYVNADFQTINAAAGVKYCLSVVEGE